MSDYISQDLLFLILKFLPVKTLIRCQSVCKSWKQIISSKSFILDHLALQNPRILAQNKVLSQNQNLEHFYLMNPQTLPLFDILRPPTGLRSVLKQFDCSLLSISHGVVCIYYDDGFLLWNPSIRRLLPVPLPRSRNYGTFESLKSFWFDPPTNEFKIVVFCFIVENGALFSSKKQKWIELGNGKLGEKIVPYHNSWQVLVDGVAHWIVMRYSGDGIAVIVSFDFGLEKLGTVELPKDLVVVDDGIGVKIFKWQDSLSVVRYDPFSSSDCVVWAMQNGSWSRMFSFKLPVGKIRSVFCVLESRGRVLALSNYEGHLVVYDPENGCSLVKSKFVDAGESSYPYEFVESLVFPDGRRIRSY